PTSFADFLSALEYELQSLTETVIQRDPIGQPYSHWATVHEAWADIRHLSGLETVKAGAVTSIVRASVRIRYKAGLAADMRVIHGGQHYSIVAVLQDANNREFTDLICEVIE